MPRGRTLLWTSIGCVIAAAAVGIALSRVGSGTASSTAPSSAPPTSAGSSPQTSGPAPVVVPKTSGALSYLSELKPSGNLGELVNPGPVKISGSIYPKSISLYCNVGDPTAFPAYRIAENVRRFQATIALASGSPSQFGAAILLVGDGHTLRTLTISAAKPKTIDVDVRGIHRLQLECFGSGNSYTGGEAVSVVWGNARFSAGR
jgi:NPCBM/NEW2 domain